MSRQLASHNDDIRRLIEKGFAVSEDSNYLVVRDIPYLDANLELATGAFVATLVAIDEHRVRQDDHQVWFAGGVPHGKCERKEALKCHLQLVAEAGPNNNQR